MIVGRSIHNQRIEHLWRAVFQGALKFYYGLFNHLKSMVYWILTVTSSLLPSLHIHSYPVEGCLEHAPTYRTENNHTPLWTRGLLARSAQDLHDIDDELLDEVLTFHLGIKMHVCNLQVSLNRLCIVTTLSLKSAPTVENSGH